MDRRCALSVLYLSSIASPALAQQRRKVPLVVTLTRGEPGDWRDRAFEAGFRDRGWVPGETLIIERIYHQPNDAQAQADEAVRRAPDVIIASATPATLAVMKATRTIPIVAVAVTDPLGTGMAESLRRPGKNVTGMTSIGVDLAAKWVQLLHEAAPTNKIAVVHGPDNPSNPGQLAEALKAGPVLGIELVPVELRAAKLSDDELRSRVKAIADDGIRAAVFLSNSAYNVRSSLIARTAVEHGLAISWGEPTFMADDILFAYGTDLEKAMRYVTRLADKVLKGEDPAEIPFEQTTHFKFILSLKAAKALGLEMPLGILYRADEIIE